MGIVLIRLAVRNVFRHPRRTVITAAAVALAVLFMTIAAGFLDFTFWGLRQSIVYAGVGHLQVLSTTVEPAGRGGAHVRERLAGEVASAARAILDRHPGVEAVAPRLEFQ